MASLTSKKRYLDKIGLWECLAQRNEVIFNIVFISRRQPDSLKYDVYNISAINFIASY